MKKSKRLWRTLLFFVLLAALCGSFALPVGNMPVSAAPQAIFGSGDIVIGEFRFRGSSGASDEFVELFNPTVAPINLNGWKLNGSNSTGTTSTRYTFTTDILLQPGQHYLLANIDPVDGIAANATYGTGITADGGIALLRPDNSIADAVGVSNGSAYKEGTTLPSFTSDVDQSYERKPGGASGSCRDNDNNSSDFQLINPSTPQNLSSSATPCIGVTNVTSSTADGTYAPGSIINIVITFSNTVNVTGTPTLLLETGATDRAATYTSGSGSSSLTFSYTVVAGDTSSDLDYVANNSLTLNGGTITGATGDAVLLLPGPGSPGSLGANNNIVIDNGLAPTVTVNQAAGQTDPAATIPINFEVVFSEPINTSTFTPSDITQNGTANPVVWSITDLGDHTNFTLSATFTSQNNVTFAPSIAPNQVSDFAGTGNSASTSTDNSVTFLDNSSPTVTINQDSTQIDPTGALPIKFAVVFSEPINTSSFVAADITQTGTATGITWTITDSGDHKNFTLQATAVTGAGTLTPSIAAGTVTDLAGNSNTVSTSTDNTVTYTPVTSLTVIINEVAWSGTAASSSDEWIELYNPGSSVIDITGWQLYGDDNTINRVGSPNISLNGTIPAGGYFLLERDEQATDVPANQVYSSGDLLNTGERLYLKDRSGNTVDTANLDGGAWPAGTASSTTASLPAYASMERVGTTGNQWVTYQGTIVEAHNRNGGDIKGTPGSANWIRTASVTTITSDLPDPSVVNQNVTVRVTVVGGISTPTGTVNITGANTNCTLTLVSGTGSCIVKFTSVGSKTLTAVYHSTSGLPVSSDTESHQVITSGTIYRTPTPIPPPPPQLIAINEFVPRPGHDWNHDGVVNVGDEYIELLNHGTVDVNLSGWRLDDEVNIGSNPYSLPSKVLKPGERIVFFGSQTGLLLGDGGDAVRLLKPNGQLIDAYNYTVVRYPDQSYCRLPDNGGADDWNQNCFPTPGLQNSLSGNIVPPSTGVVQEQPTCPIADTLPQDFVQAECDPFGDKIWRPEFWDRTGWYGEKNLPSIDGKWPVFAD